MAVVTLISSEGQQFHVDFDIAKLSGTISRLVELFSAEEESTDSVPIPLSNVASNTLERIIEWCKHHLEKTEDEDLRPEHEDNSEFVQHFLNIGNAALFDLILAANYLEVRDLLNVTCKVVADMFKNKSPADIRRMFNIVNDLTERAEKVIELETEWLNELMPYDSFAGDEFSNEPFPFLDLPNEIISTVLQQMNTVVRLRARVSRRLYLLEFLDRYRLRELYIVNGEAPPVDPSDPGKLTIGLRYEVSRSCNQALFQKLARNVTSDTVVCSKDCQSTIANLMFNDDLAGILPYIKKILSRSLTINETMCYNFHKLDPWIGAREFLDFTNMHTYISGVRLCRLFNDMAASRVQLRRFHYYSYRRSQRTFLKNLGITLTRRNRSFVSSRSDVRIFTEQTEYERGFDALVGTYYMVFGQNMLVTVKMCHWRPGGDVWIERQNEDGSLPDKDYFEGARSIESIINTFPRVSFEYAELAL